MPRRSVLRRLTAGTIFLTVGLTGFPVILTAEAAPATQKATDLASLTSATPETTRPAMPEGDFSDPPPRREALTSALDRRGVKANSRLISRDATSDTYDNGDGTSTAVAHSRPVNWKDRSGRWPPLDPRLVADGSDFKNASGPVDFKLAGETKGEDLVRASHPDGWSPRALPPALSSPGCRPRPEAAGARRRVPIGQLSAGFYRPVPARTG